MRTIKVNAKINNGIISGEFPIITTTRNGEIRKELDNGAQGTLLEILIANIANPRDFRQELKSQGRADIKHKYNYDVKSASSPIKYGNKDFIYGSSRLIYAPYLKFNILKIDNEIATIQLDIREQSIYCITKKDFLTIIEKLGLRKNNKSRDTININTLYNYTKNKPHSAKKLKELTYLLEQYNLSDDELYKKIKAY